MSERGGGVIDEWGGGVRVGGRGHERVEDEKIFGKEKKERVRVRKT